MVTKEKFAEQCQQNDYNIGMIEQLNILPKDLANYYEQYRIQKKTISTIKI